MDAGAMGSVGSAMRPDSGALGTVAGSLGMVAGALGTVAGALGPDMGALGVARTTVAESSAAWELPALGRERELDS